MDKERLKRVQKQLRQIAKKESAGQEIAQMVEQTGQTLGTFRG